MPESHCFTFDLGNDTAAGTADIHVGLNNMCFHAFSQQSLQLYKGLMLQIQREIHGPACISDSNHRLFTPGSETTMQFCFGVYFVFFSRLYKTAISRHIHSTSNSSLYFRLKTFV